MADGVSPSGVLGWLARLRSPSPRVRGALLVGAGLATVIAAVLSVDRLELSVADLRAVPLLVAALVATPLTIALNAAELRTTALASGARLAEVGWARAIRTVVLATAANLLPVPAGAALRIEVLYSAGARLAAAAGVQVAAAAVWVGISLVLAGAVLLPSTAVGWGIGGLVVGGALVVSGLLGVTRTATSRAGAAAGWLLLVEFATALVQAARLWLVLLGLGIGATLVQSVVIATASPVAAAAGFFPGGIGLAEFLSAIVAPLADLPAEAGLLAVAVARVLGLLVTVPVALGLGLGDLIRRPAGVDT